MDMSDEKEKQPLGSLVYYATTMHLVALNASSSFLLAAATLITTQKSRV